MRRRLWVLVGLVLALALVLGPAPAGAALLASGGPRVNEVGTAVYDENFATLTTAGNPPTANGCYFLDENLDEFSQGVGTYYWQRAAQTQAQCTTNGPAHNSWRFNGTAAGATTTTAAPATTTPPTTAPPTTTAPTTTPPTTAPATTTAPTTTPPTTAPPRPSCASPGPSTVQESAACDTAAQADKGRAEMLLGLCLVVLLQAAALAVGLWR